MNFQRSNLSLFAKLAGLSLLVLGLTGCPSPKVKSRGQNVTYFFKGDVGAFLDGSIRNTTSPLTPAAVSVDSRWVFMADSFVELGVHQTYQEVVQEQTPTTEDQDPFTEVLQHPYSLARSSATSNEYVLQSANNEGAILTFNDVGGRYNLTAFMPMTDSGSRRVLRIGQDLEVIHYSLHESGEMFSILLKTMPHMERRALYTLYFSKVPTTPPPTLTPGGIFEYMFGTGVTVGWDQTQPLEIKVCGLGRNMNRITGIAASKWSQHLEGRLDFKATATEHCPPFSDLNTHTVKLITGWIEMQDENVAVKAFVNPVPTASKKIIDSDMMILKTDFDGLLELQGYPPITEANISASPILEFELLETIVHEFGHVIGLHHKFGGTRSVMSYEDDRGVNLSEYDRNAVHNLYPTLRRTAERSTGDVAADTQE